MATVVTEEHLDMLDLGVVERQQIGASFTRQRHTAKRAREVADGVLHLSPHRPWTAADLTDWAADPFADRNWRFQRNTLRWLVPLAFAAMDEDDAARDEWMRLVRSWAIAHPVDQDERREVWRDMAAGLRAIVLSLGARLVSDADMDWYVELIELHRDWLLDTTNLGRGNHALHQHQGLLVVSSLLRDGETQQTAIDRMRRQFVIAFDEEGANDEGSAAYHQLNMIWWGEAWERVRVEGFAVPDTVAARFAAADEVLAHLTLPSGNLAQIGDGPVTGVRAGLGPHSTWLATDGAEGQPPTATTRVLSCGYALSRTDWTSAASYLALRFGERPGSGHPHEDRGALLVHSAGVHWLVDSGFSSYQTNDPVVTYLRSQEAHNTAALAGVKPDPDGEVVLEAANIDESVREFVLRDERYGDHRLTRRILHFTEPDCVVVLDRAVAAGEASLTLGQRWHLNPDVRARSTDRGFALVADGRRAVMHWVGRQVRVSRQDAHEGSPHGWVYPRWKTATRSTVLTAAARGRRPTVALLFAPSAPREFGLVEAHVTASGVLSATVMRGPRVWQLVIDEGVTISAVERQWS